MGKEQQESLVDEDEAIDGEEFQIPEDDIGHVKAACRIMSRKLDGEADRLKDLNQAKAEKNVRADIGELDEAIPRILDDDGIKGLNAKQRELARTGLELYVTRLRAIKGTAQGVFRTDWAAQAVEIAKHVEESVKPLLEEQLEAASTS